MTDDIRTRVLDLLAELGDTADRVAEALLQQDIKGVREAECKCPIYHYLAKHGVPVGKVGDEDIDLTTGHVVDTPSVIAAFIYGFDQGEFPELDQYPADYVDDEVES